ncbi:MAG: opioid growth factor receptor-related protein [Dissulfurispiraceae bacterium]|jgi:hypothetical protein
MGHSSVLIEFYRGSGPDNRGRYLSQILKWDYNRLEEVHDYVQWLFPLINRSAFNWRAPILTSEDIKSFKTETDLKENIAKSFDVMLGFYGFHRIETIIEKAPDYEDRIRNWVSEGNHNFLRITRILKCLCILGFQHYAKAFLLTLNKVYMDNQDKIGESYTFWEKAVQ